MSFSGDVKAELQYVLPSEAHCKMAELAALFMLYAKIERQPAVKVVLSVENPSALRKCFTLLNKTFNIGTNVFETEIADKNAIELTSENADIEKVLEKLNLSDPLALLSRDCCQRAFLRGAFLASGFIGDPSKGYHFELLSDNDECTRLLTYLLGQFNIIPKHSKRKKYSVIYVKESEVICDILNVLSAHKSMMELANARIMRDVRNGINRRNNCDTANIAKAVSAAQKQIEDIEYIKNTEGLGALSDTLREMAILRIENPESSFTELGALLNPPVGKSGVNHRLRKISDYADCLRIEREKT